MPIFLIKHPPGQYCLSCQLCWQCWRCCRPASAPSSSLLQSGSPRRFPSGWRRSPDESVLNYCQVGLWILVFSFILDRTFSKSSSFILRRKPSLVIPAELTMMSGARAYLSRICLKQSFTFKMIMIVWWLLPYINWCIANAPDIRTPVIDFFLSECNHLLNFHFHLPKL